MICLSQDSFWFYSGDIPDIGYCILLVEKSKVNEFLDFIGIFGWIDNNDFSD